MAELAFENSSNFSEYVVTPNLEVFREQSNSLQAAFNAVMSLDSLVGFIYLEALKCGATEAKNDSVFRAELASIDDHYGLIRDIAKSYKHIDLTRSASVKRADQTSVGGRPYGSGLYGAGSYGGEEVMVESNCGKIYHCLSEAILAHRFLEKFKGCLSTSNHR